MAERDGLIEPGANPCAGVRAPADQRIERAAPARVHGAVRAAGLGDPAPRLHDLRHAYATALLAAGLTVHAVAAEKAASAIALERFCAGQN